MKAKLAMLLLAAAVAPMAKAGDQDVYITEFSYKGLFGEYVEVTNTGAANVDVNGWKFNDNHALTTTPVTLFTTSTILAQNQCFIVTEVSKAVFTQAWYVDSTEGTPAGVAIFGNNSINLGKSDAINIYDSSTNLIDTLTFNVSDEDVSWAVQNTLGLGSGVLNTNWSLSATGSTPTPVGNAWKAGAPSAPGPFGSPGVYPN